MKYIFLMSFFIVALGVEAQQIHWAKSAIGAKADEGNGIVVDGSGNTYITGSFRSETLDLGTQTLTNTSSNGQDIFVAKFDTNGDCVWAKNFGGSDDESGEAIAIDEVNNVLYITGYMYTSFYFAGEKLLRKGYVDAFLLKMDLDGNELVGKNFGSNSNTQGTAVSVDKGGNVFIAGYFNGNPVDFGTGGVSNIGSTNSFIAKFSSSLTNLWAARIGGAGNDRTYAITCDGDGALYATGYFTSSSISLGTTTIINSNTNSNVFVVKYSGMGSNLWAKSIETTDDSAEGKAIQYDGMGNIYVAGYFKGSTLTVGNTITNVNPGKSNAFLAKYTDGGDEEWIANPTSGTQGNQAYSLAVSASGNLFVSGWYTSPSVNFGGINITSTGLKDNIFLAEYTPSGTVENAYSFNGTSVSNAYGNGLCTDHTNNVYMVGRFDGPNLKFGNTTLLNSGLYDVYWAKLGSNNTSALSLENAQQIQVFPNPSYDGRIQLTGLQEEYAVEVIDVLGETVYHKSNVLGDLVIDLSEERAGMYFFQIETKTEMILRKVVVNGK